MIEITLDGKKVEVREGSMVMDAANKLDTYIPHFCYHKKLTIAANCRMCLVEVEKAPKPLPACATPVTAGMIVHTRSPKAIQAQKGVMEFLLINHPLDCPICDQGGECQLQDLAVGYGGSASRYTEEKRVVFRKDSGPLVAMEEMSRCIHCTRCVRFGQEIAGLMELGMVQRGEFSEITTFVGKAIESELSGNMIDICPVGALTSRPFRYKARNWELSRRRSISPHDGLGANLIVQVKGERVMRVLPFENEAINECWLSDRDRFSYEGLNADDRLTQPMIKQDGTWHSVDWQVALEFVARGLSGVRSAHGAESIGAIASPHSTLEELHLLQKLMRGIGSENIDAIPRQSDPTLSTRLAGVPWLGMSINEFGALDRALVIGSFLRKDQPLLAQRLRQATRRGARVMVVNGSADDWLMPIAARSVVAPSRWVSSLAAIAAAVAENKSVSAPLEATAGDAERAIAAQLVTGERRAIILGAAALAHPEAAQLIALAQWLAETVGAKVSILADAANTVGAHLAGARPSAGGLDAQAQFAQARRAYLLLNLEAELDVANPDAARTALKQAELVIVLTPFKGDAMDYADVLLPIAPFSETSGTYVNTEGRAQSFNAVVRPLGDARPGWKVLRVLGNLLDVSGFDQESSEAVREEVLKGATDVAARCSNHITGELSAKTPGWLGKQALERLADVPIYFADALVRRAPALQKTHDARAPRARLCAAAAAKLGLVQGDAVRVSQGSGSATLTCEIDETIAEGVVRIAAGHVSTASLGPMFGPVTLEKSVGPA